VWQDADQDGISDAGELKSLSELGISQIKLQTTRTLTNNGNTTVLTSYGESTGQASIQINGASRSVQNINLAANPFYRDFLDSISISDAAKALPQMQGSGMVRDLREAMSLKAASGQLTTSAQALQTQVQAFQNADTAQERQWLLDSLIGAWGETSDKCETPNFIANYVDFVSDKCGKSLKFLRKTAQKRLNRSVGRTCRGLECKQKVSTYSSSCQLGCVHHNLSLV
jgi:hypothetical protein